MKYSDQTKYERAQKHVKKIKGWYNHLTIYIVVSVLLQLFYSGFFGFTPITDNTPFYVRLISPICWGIGLSIHGLYVFHGNYFRNFWKGWEERKISEIMKEDQEELKKWN